MLSTKYEWIIVPPCWWIFHFLKKLLQQKWTVVHVNIYICIFTHIHTYSHIKKMQQSAVFRLQRKKVLNYEFCICQCRMHCSRTASGSILKGTSLATMLIMLAVDCYISKICFYNKPGICICMQTFCQVNIFSLSDLDTRSQVITQSWEYRETSHLFLIQLSLEAVGNNVHKVHHSSGQFGLLAPSTPYKVLAEPAQCTTGINRGHSNCFSLLMWILHNGTCFSTVICR